jgi:large subunit ribosomal protein L21
MEKKKVIRKTTSKITIKKRPVIKKVAKLAPKLNPPVGGALAVLELGGRQHLVREGSELTVNRLDLKDGKSAKVPAVILQPSFGKGSVTYKLVEQKKGPKILIMKFKAKSRYRRKRGFRADLSRVVVEKIEV